MARLSAKAPNADSEQKSKQLKILMVGAEAAPYATVGGFSSVLAYLSKNLVERGHDVRLFIPKFGLIDEEKYETKTIYEGLKVPTGDDSNPFLVCNVKVTNTDGVQAYLLENMEYYEQRANVYGYSDDPTRWALLSRGVLEFLKTETFVPDVIHCNDWHTGLIPQYLQTVYKDEPVLEDVSTVFTIHNLRFQGVFDHKNVSELDFDDGKSAVAGFFDPRLNTLNFMKRGIIYADIVNTVSKKYSKEILTPEFGEGLDKLLLEVKGKLFGIVNGLDYDEFDPATDSLIEENYSVKSLKNRAVNKVALQKEFDLPEDETALLLGFVGRLDYQKGVDLAVETLYPFMKDYNVQFVQVGGGDGGLAEQLQKLRDAFPKKVGIHPYPNFTLPRLLFAGSDCILCPSRFEPCGIVQIEAMRYGAIPIVRKVGGLADTVENFDSITGKGNGFVFTEFDKFSLFGQLVRAYELFRNKKMWQKLQVNAMGSDFSWDFSAKEYERLYRNAISFKNKPQPKLQAIKSVME
jgi:starch synthase